VWKEGKMHEELPYRLLKPYAQFQFEFEQQKKKRRTAVAPTAVQGHGQHA
jgi:hypothetical protein